jgi:hypothetical protein
MVMRAPLRVLNESEAKPDSFHDCHIHGLHWRQNPFLFYLDIQYILQWIEPNESTFGYYSFIVSEACLVFDCPHDIIISMDFRNKPIEAVIDSIKIIDSKLSPNGTLIKLYQIDLFDDEILLWSPEYKVILLSEPVISKNQNLVLPDEFGALF